MTHPQRTPRTIPTGALALIAASCIALGTMALLAPPAQAEPDPPTIEISREDAVKEFGTSEVEGVSSLDTYTEYLDDNGDTWVPVFMEEPERASVEQQERSSRTPSLEDGEQSVNVTLSRYSQGQIDSALDELKEIASSLDSPVTLRFDPSTDTIEVASPEQQQSAFREWDGDVEISFETMNVQPNVNKGFSKPHYSAMASYSLPHPALSLNDEWGYCTLGIPARNSAGTPGMFGAGHCLRLGTNVFSGPRKGSALYVGHTSHAYGLPDVDAAFISNGDFRPYLLTGAGRSTARPITGEYYASIGNRLCFNGTSSGRNCQNDVRQFNVTACYFSYCSEVNMLAGGPTSVSGDSGAPVYANFNSGSEVRVNGIIWGNAEAAGGTPGRTFVTSWADIKNNYSATLWTA